MSSGAPGLGGLAVIDTEPKIKFPATDVSFLLGWGIGATFIINDVPLPVLKKTKRRQS